MSSIKGVGNFFALDVGSGSIKVVELSGDVRRGWSLGKFGYAAIGSDISIDAGDEGQKRLGEAIKDVVRQSGISTRNVVLSLPADKTFTTVVEVPNQSPKEISKSMKYYLEQFVPMSLDEARVDYAILGPSLVDSTKVDVLISSVATSFVERRMDFIESLGLNVVGMEPESLSVARSLMLTDKNDVQVIVDFGELSSNIIIVHNKVPRLVRTVSIGFGTVARNIAASLSVTIDQAKQFMVKFGFNSNGANEQFFAIIDNAVSNLIDEVRKTITFYLSKSSGLTIDCVILSSFACNIPLMMNYVEAKINFNTICGNLWQYVRLSSAQQNAIASVANEFAVAVGLAERNY